MTTKPIRKKLIIKHKSENEESATTFRLFDFKAFDNNNQEEVVEDKKKHQASFNNRLFRIQMFGLNELGQTCMIYIDGFCPFFYIKVTNDWTAGKVKMFESHLCEQLKSFHSGCLKSAVLVNHNKLYEFTGNMEFQFVKLTFSNIDVFNKVRNMWYESKVSETGEYTRKYKSYHFGGDELFLYESKIPPLLRYFHIHEISPSGWIEITQFIVPKTKSSSCVYEYICTPKSLKPLPNKETRVPYKICSFDIEASSSHGDFPLPKKNYKRLATQIVDSFQKRGDNLKPDKADQLLKQMILAAFSIGSVENIDCVYPKQNIVKAHIKESVLKLLTSSLKEIESHINEAGSEHISLRKTTSKICNMFEKIADEAKTLEKVEENNNEEETETSFADGGFGSGIGEVPEHVYFHSSVKSDFQKEEETLTLTSVLLHDAYSRETKIRILNEKMTNHPGFPELKGDEVTFIGSTFMRYGETEPYKNHCIVVGSCEKIPGAEIQSVPTESACLEAWADLISIEDPDIIIGYNIFGFDYAFMFQRAQELGIVEKAFNLSRIIGETCFKESGKNREQSLEMTKNRLASGDYELHYPAISGRLQIDLLFYFRRDYNLSSFKLDDVAGNFIRDDIVAVEINKEENTTKLYSKNLAGLNVNDFIHIEMTSFTVDYYMKGKKFRVKELLQNVAVVDNDNIIKAGVYNVIVVEGQFCDLNAKTQALKWGMAKDDVSPQDIFRLTRGSSTDRAIVAKYCIQDCNLVQHLMKKTDILTGYNEMAGICSVPISFLVFRGQGIKLTSYVAKVCRQKNTLMPDLEHVMSDDGYEGAIVLPPKCAMYGENPVACNDYSSLYPSIAKAWNLSPNSKVWTKLYDLQNNLKSINGISLADKSPLKQEALLAQSMKYDLLPGYRYIETQFDHFETVQLYTANGKLGRKIKEKRGRKVCRWAIFPEGQEGIIPCIIGDLLKARKETRVKGEKESDPFLSNVLDKRQLGYKVTANSLYGQMGSSVSTFFEKDVAASITAIGRMMITYAKRMVEEIYNDLIYSTKNEGTKVRTRSSYVYGDTDSVFFTFNLEDVTTGAPIRGKEALRLTIEIAQEAAYLCSLFLPPPMELAYEKTLMSFILLSKKRYVGMLYEKDPNKGKLKFMGLPLKRRDSCDYVKDVYGGILTILMKEPDNIQKAIEFLNTMLQRLVNGEVSMEKLAITKALRGYYKNPSQIAHRVLADRIGEREPGNKPKPGDRIKYVFILCNADPDCLLGNRIETPEYITKNKLSLDYTYYITNQLMNPLQQLLSLAVEKIYEVKKKRAAEFTEYRKQIEQLRVTSNDDLELFMKKREKYCSQQVKRVLFEPFLTDLYNKNNGIQTLMQFYKKKV
jgi:DNA polymerase elongation subunit (family B)